MAVGEPCTVRRRKSAITTASGGGGGAGRRAPSSLKTAAGGDRRDSKRQNYLRTMQLDRLFLAARSSSTGGTTSSTGVPFEDEVEESRRRRDVIRIPIGVDDNDDENEDDALDDVDERSDDEIRAPPHSRETDRQSEQLPPSSDGDVIVVRKLSSSSLNDRRKLSSNRIRHRDSCGAASSALSRAVGIEDKQITVGGNSATVRHPSEVTSFSSRTGHETVCRVDVPNQRTSVAELNRINASQNCDDRCAANQLPEKFLKEAYRHVYAGKGGWFNSRCKTASATAKQSTSGGVAGRRRPPSTLISVSALPTSATTTAAARSQFRNDYREATVAGAFTSGCRNHSVGGISKEIRVVGASVGATSGIQRKCESLNSPTADNVAGCQTESLTLYDVFIATSTGSGNTIGNGPSYGDKGSGIDRVERSPMDELVTRTTTTTMTKLTSRPMTAISGLCETMPTSGFSANTSASGLSEMASTFVSHETTFSANAGRQQSSLLAKHTISSITLRDPDEFVDIDHVDTAWPSSNDVTTSSLDVRHRQSRHRVDKDTTEAAMTGAADVFAGMSAEAKRAIDEMRIALSAGAVAATVITSGSGFDPTDGGGDGTSQQTTSPAENSTASTVGGTPTSTAAKPDGVAAMITSGGSESLELTSKDDDLTSAAHTPPAPPLYFDKSLSTTTTTSAIRRQRVDETSFAVDGDWAAVFAGIGRSTRRDESATRRGCGPLTNWISAGIGAASGAVYPAQMQRHSLRCRSGTPQRSLREGPAVVARPVTTTATPGGDNRRHIRPAAAAVPANERQRLQATVPTVARFRIAPDDSDRSPPPFRITSAAYDSRYHDVTTTYAAVVSDRFNAPPPPAAGYSDDEPAEYVRAKAILKVNAWLKMIT